MKRVCVLTGASGVLGTALIRQLGRQTEIAAVYHEHELEAPTQDHVLIDPLNPGVPLEAPGVFAVQADLADESGVEAVCRAVLERFGRIDLLINAAAVRRWGHFTDSKVLADADVMLRVNVLAPLRLAAGFARHFWRSRVEENIRLQRNVVNVSSTAGVYVYPDLGQCLYATSKAALNMATYHMASELWDIGVRVNCVAPNTFPGRVSVQSVVDAVTALDRSEKTGRLVLVDEPDATADEDTLGAG